MVRLGAIFAVLAAWFGISSAASGQTPFALLRGDGTMEFRMPGEDPIGRWKLYVHNDAWKQAQATDSIDRQDTHGDSWRVIGGKLAIPGEDDRYLNHLQKFSLAEGGFDVEVDLRFRRSVKLKGANVAMFWDTARLGGDEAWVTTPAAKSQAVRLPASYEGMIRYQGDVTELRIPGPMPLTVTLDAPVNLVIQDNREYGIDTFEFRFNFIPGGAAKPGEHLTARMQVRFAEPTAVHLDESTATSRTDTSAWSPFVLPPDGAPVDLSWLNERPAGGHGFLQVKGDKLVFADGTEARFFGTNLSGEACFPEPEDAVKLADRLARFGINLVRIHHGDAPWASRCFIDYTRDDTRHLNLENLARFHRLAAELRERGIYIYLDQLVQRQFKPGDGVDAAGELPLAAKPYALFDPRLIELQQEYTRALWTTVNPLTGLAPKDDPQYVLMEFANEHDLFTYEVTLEPYKSRFVAAYRAWGKERALPTPTLDWHTPSASMMAFLVDRERAYQELMTRFCRDEVGIRIPLTGSNWSRTTALLYALRDMDYTEAHAYSDHPWKEDGHWRFANTRSTAERRNIFANHAFNRLAGKPFMAAEWDQSWPNEWRAELPLLAASVAAFQGWNGVLVYTYRHYSAPVDFIEEPFETAFDPARFGLFPHAALLYRRDVAPARQTVTVRVDPERARSGDPLAEWDAPAALAATPELHRVEERFATRDEAAADTATTWVESGDEVLPASAAGVTSDTGQLFRSWDIGYGTIDTPGTQAYYGTRGLFKSVRLSDMHVDLESRFATIAVSSLTDQPIRTSKRLLVTAVARAENTGMVYGLFRDVLLDRGKGPVLIEPVKATVRLRHESGHPKVQAIDGAGQPLATIEATSEGGWVSFALPVPSQTIYYLVTE